MDITIAKVIAMVLLGGISLLLGFLPLKLGSLIETPDYGGRRRHSWKQTITSVLLCFGGGVLLATSFVHMLPEVRESIESTSYDLSEIPAAEIFFCCGFFLIYFIEELVHCACDKVHSDNEVSIQVHKTFSVHSRACKAGGSDMQLRQNQNLAKKSASPIKRRVLSPTAQRYDKSSSEIPTYFYNDKLDIWVKSPVNGLSHSVAMESDHADQVGESVPLDSDDSHVVQTRSSVRDFLTVLALSCHAIFEGLAVGLEKDTEAVWTLFAAVATHKYVLSFCIGLELLTAQTPIKLFAAYMCVFSLVSPLGIAFGIGISSAAGTGGDAYTLAVAILQALAGGTLIYVVVFEVLQREKSKGVSGMAQLAFVILGFSCLMCIEVFTGHNHHHKDHE